MKFEWSQFALQDRDRIFDYIEQDDPRTAIMIDERIGDISRLLGLFPESGRNGRIEGTRELVVHHTSYIAVYSIKGNVVRILRVLHGAQLWPDEIKLID